MIAHKLLILAVIVTTAIVRGDELTCDGDYTQNEKFCYKLMDGVDEITIAEANCKKKEGNLISIHNDKENAFATAFGVDLLIGLLYDSKAKNYSWIDGTPFDMKNWEAGYPMDPDYFGECVILQKSGKWINAECGWKFQYVCKKPISSHLCPAPPNNQLFNGGEVSSPGFPGNYISGLSCSYMLIVKNNDTVRFEPSVNEMGTGDVIEIFSRLVADERYRIGVLDSSSGLQMFTTPKKENKMLVKFTSKSQTGGFWKFGFSSSACANGWIDGGENGLNYCYKVIKENKKFAEAKSRCQGDGAQLISIRNAFQNKFINEKMGEDSLYLWMGLVYTSGSWKWTDRSDSRYTNWNSGEPRLIDGNCTRMMETGRWQTINCASASGYPLCYKP